MGVACQEVFGTQLRVSGEIVIYVNLCLWSMHDCCLPCASLTFNSRYTLSKRSSVNKSLCSRNEIRFFEMNGALDFFW